MISLFLMLDTPGTWRGRGLGQRLLLLVLDLPIEGGDARRDDRLNARPRHLLVMHDSGVDLVGEWPNLCRWTCPARRSC